MYFVYVLRNRKDKFYVGYTRHLRQRVIEHNKGQNTSTKSGRPWNLVYFEGYGLKQHAQNREKQLKQHGKGLSVIKKRIGLNTK